jgi:hypothetical protein
MQAHGWTTWFGPRPARAEESWQDFLSLLAWVLGLQVLDLLTTLGSLAHGAAEANPLAAALLDAHGTAGLVQLKVVAAVLALGWLPAFALARSSALATWTILGALALLAVLYSAVVVNNLAVLTAQVGA